MRICWNIVSAFGRLSNPVPGIAREKLHAIHQHSFLLFKSIWFLFHSLAYLVSRLFFTDSVLRCICISLECHWVTIVLTQKKRKINIPIIPALFFGPSGICISTNWVPERTEYISNGWFGSEDGISRWHS